MHFAFYIFRRFGISSISKPDLVFECSSSLLTSVIYILRNVASISRDDIVLLFFFQAFNLDFSSIIYIYILNEDILFAICKYITYIEISI